MKLKQGTILWIDLDPVFIVIDKDKIHGTALLQHIRVIDPRERTNGEVVTTLSEQEINSISAKVQQFF